MAGGGGALPEPGFLDIPTFTIAAVLACFLLASMVFEKSTHWLVQFLRKRKRNGLAQAVENLIGELTLVGFIALLLTVLQGPISQICVAYSPGAVDLWSLISNVNGCDCCLSDTATVGACFQVDRQCGPGYCNCDSQDPSCVVAPTTLADLLSEWRADPVCGVVNTSNAAVVSCATDYLTQAVESQEAELASSLLKLECDGMVQRDKTVCGPGRMPLISVTAQHQVHIFIFSVAMMHVVLGVVCVVLASWRIHFWRRMCSDEDEHMQRVRDMLHSSQASTPRWRSTVLSRWGGLGIGLRRSITAPPMVRSREVNGDLGNGSVANGKEAEAQQQQDGLDEEQQEEQQQERQASEQQEQRQQARTRFADVVKAASLKAAGSAAQLHTKSEDSSAVAAADTDHADPAADASAAAEAAAAAAAAAAEAGEAGGELAAHPQPPLAVASTSTLSAEGSQPSEPLAASPRQVSFGALPEEPASAAARHAKPAPHSQMSKLIRRTSTIKRGDHVGWLQEQAICLAYCFWPTPASLDDIRLMRASFMLTHRVPQAFDFWGYLAESMEDDFSQIVGVNLEMWGTMVLFVLISGPLGWAALLFLCIAAALLLIVNHKLISITRHVCRGCRANHLTTDVFWFRRPSLLLHPIKYILFLCSFLFGSAIFFVWSFGAGSCPFTSDGNKFYFAWSAPWYISLIVAGIIFLDISLRTLPLYSLAVQMGSEFKHHMLPRGVREKLLVIAQHIKTQHKQQQRAAAAAEGGGVRSKMRQVKQRLSS